MDGGIVMLGVFATALFYGDRMITPAISVLSAVEGLTTVNAGLEPYVIPIAIGILVGLFAIQSPRHGQGRPCSALSCWSISRPSRRSASSHPEASRGALTKRSTL